jgi:hypothetical protein
VEPYWAEFLKGIRKELKEVKLTPGLAVAAVAISADVISYFHTSVLDLTVAVSADVSFVSFIPHTYGFRLLF